ncbi:MAG: plastocyanin/azurin family copper-binding protein [Dehalococcoidia bacterium]|nr:plastocyanin/azurin family copper-binding protein [Dehalococcoidia bacterium]
MTRMITRRAIQTAVRSGVAALLVAVAALATASPAQAGGGGCHSTALTTGSGEAVDMELICFGPTVLYVEPGATVTWTNRDPVDHAVTGAAMAFGSYDLVAPGGTVSATFNDPGVFPYFCFLHPSMVGAVVVGDADAPATSEFSAGDEGTEAGAGARIAPGLLLGLGGLVVGAAGMSVAPRLMRKD